MKKIAPSILSADFTKLGTEIKGVEDAGADYIHIDIMDGQFVPNITVGPLIVEASKRATKLPLDVHLMIESPHRLIDDFAKAGSDIITIHAEADRHLHRTVQRIKDLGKRAGVSLNPATPLSAIEHIIEGVDMVLIMSVNPGFGGQRFIKSVIPKIKKLRKIIDEKGLDVELEIDGGINLENIGEVSKAGVDVFVAGSYIFGSKDYKNTIAMLRKEAD